MTTDDRELRQMVEQLQAEADELVLARFTNDDAWEMGSWAVEVGRARELSITVDIRRGEHQLFHAALAGTSADNDSWAERKARSVRRFNMASLLLGRLHRLHAGEFNEVTGLPVTEYVAAGGCIPIVVEGVGPVGTLAVSGLTEEDDHELAVEIIRHQMEIERAR